MKIKGEVEQIRTNFTVKGDIALVMGTRLCVPVNDEMKRESLEKAHNFALLCILVVVRCDHVFCFVLLSSKGKEAEVFRPSAIFTYS